MKGIIINISILSVVFFGTSISNAVLIDHGEMFYDDYNNLYWYDPIYWATDISSDYQTPISDPAPGLHDLFSRVESFISINTDWRWASKYELELLYGNIYQSNLSGTALEGIMGTHTGVDAYDKHYWSGLWDYVHESGVAYSAFLNSTENQGTNWVSPLRNAPVYWPEWSTIGAWIVTDTAPHQGPAPVPEPATMVLLGTGLAGLIGVRMRKRK